MPVKIVPLALRLALLPVLASAQITYRDPVSSPQTILPSEGPGSARFNPAALADIHLASFTYGIVESIRKDVHPSSLQLAIGTPWDWVHWPVCVAAGLGYYDNSEIIDGSNQIVVKSEWDPSLAVAFPASPQAPLRISAGIALTQITYNAFGVIENHSGGTDAGLMGEFSGEQGRFGVGCAYHHMLSPRVRMPDNGDDYSVPGWQEWSTDWSSPSRRVRLRMSLYFDDSPDPAEGPAQEPRFGINGWDVELRPVDWLAVKLERPRLALLSSLGLVFYPPQAKAPANVRFEVNVGDSDYNPAALLGYKPLPEDFGWLWGLSLSVGI